MCVGSVRARARAAGSEAQKFGRYEIFFGVSPGWGGGNRGGGQKTGAGKIGAGDQKIGEGKRREGDQKDGGRIEREKAKVKNEHP